MREYDDDVTQPLEQNLTLTVPKPNYTLTFNNKEGQQVGGFDFNGDTARFDGNAEESARVFVDWIVTIFNGRLKEEYERGRTEALADHGISGGK